MRRRRTPGDLTADEIERFFGSLPAVVRQLRNGRRVNMFLATFGLFAILLLSWRTELQDDKIQAAAERDRASAFGQCQLVNDNARALNSFLDAAVAAVKSNPALDRDEKDYRVSLYLSIKQRLPVCAKP